MKASLIVAVAFALTTSAALAQTVAPGTAPGAQTGTPSNQPSAGSPDQTNSIKTNDNMSSSTSRSDKKMMRKSGKMKSSDGSMKTKTKM
jgi:hypothetical protein